MATILGNMSEYISTNPMPMFMNMNEYNHAATSEKIVDLYSTVGAYIMQSLEIDPNIEKIDIVLQLKDEKNIVRYRCDVPEEYDMVTYSEDYED